MMGERTVAQEALFYEFSLERHVPADHLLRSIDRFVDLSELRESASVRSCLFQHYRPKADVAERLPPSFCVESEKRLTIPLRGAAPMGYRLKDEIIPSPLVPKDNRPLFWALLAIAIANLGPLAGRLLVHRGFHASGEALSIGALVMAALCLVGGAVAFVQTRKQVAKDLADLQPRR